MMNYKLLKCTVFFYFFLILSITGFINAGDKKEFSNPLLMGFYPDPSVCRVGSDYYLVTSSFAYYPGIPVFHSKDLVNWELISYVLNNPDKFDLTGAGVSRGLFAPAIRYYNNLYYVTCTLVDKGGNFVCTAKNPGGPWSDPVWLPELNAIDPSLFFDDNGKSYIIYNSIPPDNKSLYQGHRTIRMYEFDKDKLAVKGEEKIIINGGTDINKKPVWIEAPHILKKDGFYYLICAEGGTAEDHSEVVFRSDKAEGPYIPFNNNPILTQRDLSPDRKDPITSTGHADFVQTEAGDWWAVFLGCRTYPPYKKDYYNTGRETFLAPVKWENGWPEIIKKGETVKYHYPYPVNTNARSVKIPFSGNFKIRDDFSGELDKNWVFLRTPKEKWYETKESILSIKLRPETCSGKENPSFLGRRQQHLTCDASTALIFSPVSENEKAGLLIFQNEDHYYYICKSIKRDTPYVELYKGNELIASDRIKKETKIFLKIEAHDSYYNFLYALKEGEWKLLKDNVDASFLSTKTAGGFVGCMFAMYATSNGKPSDSYAGFDWFEYRGADKVYRKHNSPESNSNSGKFLGNIFGQNIPSNFRSYWNQVTPENAGKWNKCEASQDRFSWDVLDNFYNNAIYFKLPFKYHNLIWNDPSYSPSWLSDLDSASQVTEVEQWIDAVAHRYTKISFVDVVNEPLHKPPTFKNLIGGSGTTGWDWVLWAYEKARAVFPDNVKLLINEYNVLNSDSATTQYLEIINLLKSRNLVDGIGIQCHYFEMKGVPAGLIKNNLDRLAATGLPIYISEYDVDEADDNVQLSVYKTQFKFLWEYPGIKGITLWGWIQGQTWQPNAYLIRKDGTERPALQWLRENILNQKK
jgi:alpha-N-arabinofuranosidase